MSTHASKNTIKKIVRQNRNRNATIRTREDRTGKLRTETFRRDNDSITAAISTNPKTDSTAFFIDFPDTAQTFRLDGRQARTIYRLLQKHYMVSDKTY